MTPPRARLAAGLLGMALLAGAGPARGVTFTVNSTEDSDDGFCNVVQCTLREAINEANALSGPDVIDFDASLQDESITLESSLPDVTDELRIEGGTVNVTLTGLAGMTLVTLDSAAVGVEIMDVNLAQGDIVVRDGVIFFLDQTEMSGTVPGRISGMGALEKLGPDALILEGINSYTAGTRVREGALQGDSDSLQGSIVVDSDAELIFDQAATGTYAGVLSGEGALVKTGVGTLVLTGANTHSGGTRVDEGILQGDASSLQGDIAVETVDPVDEGLVFNQTDNGTYAGALSGGGSVFKRGGGQLTLSGDNSGLDGDFVFEDGTLVLASESAPPVIVNEGVDEGDQVVLDFAGSFTGSITGQGGASSGFVTKRGSGDLSLGASGDTGEIRAQLFTVEEGLFSLTVDAVFDGGFQIDSGAILQGESLAANITGAASFFGTVAPGGAQNVAELRTGFDAATFQSSSTLQIDVQEPDEVDLFEAQSVVVEEGARLQLALTGEPDFVDVPVVEAPGGLSCPVANTSCFEFDQDFFFFEVTPTLNEDATQLLLSIETLNNAFESFAQTPNEVAVARVLDRARMDDELGDFFSAISGLEDPDVPALLNALSGEIATGFVTPRLAAKQRLDRTLELQVRGFASRAPGFVPTAGNASGARSPGVGLLGVASATGPGVLMAFQPEPGETGFGAWIDGYGVFGEADGSNGAGTLSYGVYGTTLGLDARLSEHFLVGAAAGYARLEPELRSASGTGDLGQGSLFAVAVWDRIHVAGWGRYAYGGYETRRPIGFGADVTAKGSFDGWEYSGHGEAGVHLLELRGFELRSLASIDYAHLEQDGYTEKGAVVGDSDMNLQVPGESWNSLVSGLGARVHRIWELQEGTWFVPEIHARWLHEFEDTDRRVVPTLLGADRAYTPFIQGAALDRDGMVAGLGWTVSSADGLHVYGDYEVNWNPKLIQHSIKAGFRFLF